jgi:hypothetical protein
VTQLIPPRVALPLSECSSHVRLQGLVPGTDVTVMADGQAIVYERATQSDQTFQISGQLIAGQTVVAKQDFATEGSDFTPDGVKVLRGPANPSEVSAVDLVSHLYACASCLWLDGAFPGATVDVRVGTPGSQSVTSADGNAYVSLSSPVGSGEFIQVQQAACGFAGPTTQLPAPDPTPVDSFRRVLAPQVSEPLRECQQQLTVEKVVEGATVTIHREGGDEFACVTSTSSRLNLVHPLHQGEKITASQAFPGCEYSSERSQPAVEVGPADLPPPFLHGPICNRDRAVRVSGLEPGAHVMFMSGPNEFAYGTAWDTVCDFKMPDLFGVAALSVKQGHCSPVQWSPTSNEVKVDAQPTLGDLFLKVIGPLRECGRLVHVRGCAPGITVYLISKSWGGPIGWSYATDFEVDIAVPPLQAGDFVHAAASLCGSPYTSPEEEVVALSGRLTPPTVSDPVEDCGGAVRVLGVEPGARVDVYVNGVFAGSARTALSEANVPVAKPLADGDSISARQSLCGQTTDLGEKVPYQEDLDVDFVPFSSGHISERVCQLTGERDSEPGHAHLNNTTQWGVYGTDLGINFHHAGRHYIFFGDEGIDVSPDELRDADPVFYTTDLAAEPSGFRMQPILQAGANKFRRLAVNGFADLGNFEVPTGGFSYNNKIFLFIALRNPAPMQRSFLVSGTDPHNPFDSLFQVDSDPVGGTDDPNATNPNASKFINISPWVVRNANWPGLPATTGDGLLLYGSGWYRRSGVCLAWAPLTPGSDPPPPDEWRFFDAATRKWSDPGDIGFAEPFGGPDAPAQVGEFSVSWVPDLHRWVMLSEQGIVRGHVARRPTGPWFRLPQEVFEATRDGALTKYVHVPGQDNLADRAAFAHQQGGAYGPYLVSRFTRWHPWTRTATLYYVISTHVPYQVMFLKVRLRCG